MEKNKVMDLLKEIKYPGYSRNIISFGMVKDVRIEKDSIIILLNSVSIENQSSVKENISSLFSDKGISKKVIVEFLSDKANKNNTNQNAQSTISGVKHTIAVASGKGGVGKSTVSMNLASSLSKNYKVGILDLDIYGPSLPTILGVNKQPKLTEDQKIIPLDCHGMKVMSFGLINSTNSATIWRGPMVARLTQQFFDDVLWGELDYLILDLPPGTGDIQLTLVQKIALSGAIIITTPQDLSLIDAAKAADMFKKVNTPILGIIENMSYYIIPGTNEKVQIFPGNAGAIESKRLNVPLIGKIMINPAISAASDSGVPYVLKHESTEVAKIFQEISEEVVNNIN